MMLLCVLRKAEVSSASSLPRHGVIRELQHPPEARKGLGCHFTNEKQIDIIDFCVKEAELEGVGGAVPSLLQQSAPRPANLKAHQSPRRSFSKFV